MRPAEKDRVVVTGLGVVSPAGNGATAFWRSILRGQSHIRPNPHFAQTGKKAKVVGLADFEAESIFSWIDADDRDGGDRVTKIARRVIEEALEAAGLGSDGGDPAMRDAGLFISTAIGPITTMECTIRRDRNGADAETAPWHAFSFGRMVSSLAHEFGFGGPYAMLPTGCAGGCDAVGYGLKAIRAGHVDLAVVGAFEAPVTPFVESAFERINATSSRQCRPDTASCPFDVRRDGFVLGEGGGALVLESERAARARGATPLAVVSGFGSACSAYHMTDIHISGEAIARSIDLALKDAGLPAEAIDHANLHGSSTPMNDIAEANALRTVLRERAAKVPVTSLKSQIGHAMAAANTIELVAVVLTVLERAVPPTANLVEQDPQIGLDVVAPWPRITPVHNALKTASGFGGIHSSLIISEYGG